MDQLIPMVQHGDMGVIYVHVWYVWFDLVHLILFHIKGNLYDFIFYISKLLPNMLKVNLVILYNMPDIFFYLNFTTVCFLNCL